MKTKHGSKIFHVIPDDMDKLETSAMREHGQLQEIVAQQQSEENEHSISCRVWKETSRKELCATGRLTGKYVFYNGNYVPRDARKMERILLEEQEERARMDIQVGQRTQVKMDAFMIRMQQLATSPSINMSLLTA
ncbi:hypothetical protein H5410_034210 [Solanum commersonii]|uniref:Uncharacterized protein n=1 Tax=Solanum commersonii TaxID=4109 RepID=A0A9J5YSX3_SOLCO|nr:hypothetical protein H5410_034210 [Solanum commersonii]